METLEDMTSQGQMQLQHAVVTNRSVTAPLQESMLSLDLGQEDSSATHHAEVSVGDDESYIRDTTTEGEERANSKHRGMYEINQSHMLIPNPQLTPRSREHFHLTPPHSTRRAASGQLDL